MQLTEIATFDAPLAVVSRAGSSRLHVVEQPGRIIGVELDGSDPSTVLDIGGDTVESGEQGLLGAAFSPDGDLLYIDYTDPSGTTHIDEYRMDGDTADAGSRREVLTVEQPFPNHNGGGLVFGPDGFLYIGLGDGGGGGDPLEAGQDRSQVLGSILRIDPAGGDPYAVPTDNPFVDDGDSRPEIWISGVRNPWRFSFDSLTDDLWIGDVGQNEIEEITWLAATGDGAGRGANLGWNLVEGTQPFAGEAPADHSPPVFEYDHSAGDCSVTGGFAYRGPSIPDLRGAYVYGDFCVSEIRALVQADGELLEERSNLLGHDLAADRVLRRRAEAGDLVSRGTVRVEDDGPLLRWQHCGHHLDRVVTARHVVVAIRQDVSISRRHAHPVRQSEGRQVIDIEIDPEERLAEPLRLRVGVL